MNISSLKNILFLDIETVSQKANLDELDSRFKALWEKKSATFRNNNSSELNYEEKAAISAEFGKIICIGTGYFTEQDGELIFRTRSITNDSEKTLLVEFSEMLNKLNPQKNWRLCAHNGKEFDFPYLCRRMLISNLPLPLPLQIMGRKPWETAHLIDTMEMWKFGDVKAYTSLDLMAASLGVPSSKDDIDGSQVGRVFYETGDISRIAKYCQKDVSVMAMVYMRLLGMEILEPAQIIHQRA